MAGLYIHVPFCKGRCIYCDFYSTTESEERKSRYVSSLLCEIETRCKEFSGARVHSIYMGGGTPSQLPVRYLAYILDQIFHYYDVDADAEITVEANPDDVTEEWLSELRKTPVNRLSMGVQTFSDELLQLLHRRHTSQQAIDAVRLAQKNGLDNISIDLIYGLPGQTMKQWEMDVQQAFSLDVQHLSAYALSYEEGTVLTHMLERGEVCVADEELSLGMYEYLMDAAARAGFFHYEISNFSLPGKESFHNSSYWKGVPYLGFGPGAHSYDGGRIRRWNLSNLAAYVNSSGQPPCQSEVLSDDELYDELVMTRLRTNDGLPLGLLSQDNRTYCLAQSSAHLQSGRMALSEGVLKITRQGIFTSNDIISDLMKG